MCAWAELVFRGKGPVPAFIKGGGFFFPQAEGRQLEALLRGGAPPGSQAGVRYFPGSLPQESATGVKGKNGALSNTAGTASDSGGPCFPRPTGEVRSVTYLPWLSIEQS